ncbi:MAG TPA: IclR family transcriptional regulator [Afifellaceae bacterium]|nr:IclR family transcriptional regulator [Afifellaceae bacterium]
MTYGDGHENGSDDRSGGGQRIPTNLRMLLIIEVLAKAGRPMTPTEINAEIGLPKQSIHRLCTTLIEAGFLTRDVDARRLRPTGRLRAISSGLLAASRSHAAQRRALQNLSAAVGETCNLVAAEEEGMFYIDRVETQWPLRIQLPVGSHVPFHCTASGKMFLASLPKAELNSMLAVMTMDVHARNTITDAKEMRRELGRSAERGYSVDDEEFIDGMIAVAAPIIDPNGRFHAAVAFHAPVQRMTLDTALGHVGLIFEAADQIRTVLFGEPD